MAKLRIGIIGAGGRGTGLGSRLPASGPDAAVEIVACADTNPVRARASMEQLGLEADIHEDAEALCKRKDLDAVLVTTPDFLHEEHALLALKHKKHVFVDKPLASTVEGCLRILEASLQAQKLLYMGFNLRHQAVIRRLKRLVDEGLLGDIFSIYAMEHYCHGRTYFSRWNCLKKFSGGLWVHKGSHDFDIINYLMGGVRPARVSCFASVFSFRPERLPFKARPGVEPGPTCHECAYREECPDAAFCHEPLFGERAAAIDGYHKDLCMYLSDKDTHDQGVAIIEYENGATATHTECFATPSKIGGRRYFIDGTGGHAEADIHGGHNIRFYPRWSGDVVTYDVKPESGGHDGADPKMLGDFVSCILDGRRPLVNAVAGTWSVAMAVAAEISREEKRVVELSELMDTKSDMLKAPA